MLSFSNKFTVLCLISIFTLLTGCVRPEEESSSVTISFPKSLSVSSSSSGLQSLANNPGWNSTAPTDLSDINCFVVLVGASNQLNESSCKNDSDVEIARFGLMGGMVKSGQSVTLEIPSGSIGASQRTDIQLMRNQRHKKKNQICRYLKTQDEQPPGFGAQVSIRQ